MKYSVAFHPEEIVRIEIDNAINEDDALEMAWDELDRLLLTGELTAKDLHGAFQKLWNARSKYGQTYRTKI